MRNPGMEVAVCCSDVSGAFGRVYTGRLLNKLSGFGLNACVLEVLRSWLGERRAHVVVGGEKSQGFGLRDMVFQGTVWGPCLWNSFIGDSAAVVWAHGFYIVIFADDINAYKAYPAVLSNDHIFHDMNECQSSLHKWGQANQVMFDASKESFSILSLRDPAGEAFKVLGITFDTALCMRDCAHECAVEAGWRQRTLLRTHRFYNDAELVNLFKAHVLSFVEYRTPALYHSCSTVLAQVDRILASFLRKIGITDIEALIRFRLAPLSLRRDIAMLGVIHRAVLHEGPPQFWEWFRVDTADLR